MVVIDQLVIDKCQRQPAEFIPSHGDDYSWYVKNSLRNSFEFPVRKQMCWILYTVRHPFCGHDPYLYIY